MKIYLASPYSSTDPANVEYRVKQINNAAAELMNQGHIVFSPISHSHYIAVQEDLPKTFEFWQEQNHSFIEWADIVYILTLEGWEKSKGVKDEIEFAKSIDKNIILMKEIK